MVFPQPLLVPAIRRRFSVFSIPYPKNRRSQADRRGLLSKKIWGKWSLPPRKRIHADFFFGGQSVRWVRGKPQKQHQSRKNAAAHRLPQPYFCVKSRRTPVLAGCGDQTVSAGILTCGSSANPGLLGICREPDRLQSGPRSLPMTGFRLPGGLHAYSGGTVREFHPIPYSPSPPTRRGKH